jgi:hypothetical protein
MSIMFLDILGVPGIDDPYVAQLLAGYVEGHFRRNLSALGLILVMYHRHRYRFGMMAEQFPYAILQGDPGIVHLVHEQNAPARELSLSLFYPLQLRGNWEGLSWTS